jgi:protein-S-isoprenylcysteine O-methyltransferase Ste14
MKDLNQQALGGLLWFLIILAAAVFVPAWTVNYWQAWIFLGVFSLMVLTITVYLMKNDPKLLERRVKAGPGAETEKRQKIIQSLASIAFIAVVVFPAIDHRLAWSRMPPEAAVAGDVIVALGLLIIFFVFKENAFTSAIIEIDPEQRVISTGPYAFVRHPMYIGTLVMLLGMPVALCSWWGLFMVIPIALLIVWRLIDEEQFLARNLGGYAEYRHKVKYRLVPFIW